MTVKERILTIRLLEKWNRYPEYGIRLGIQFPARKKGK